MTGEPSAPLPTEGIVQAVQEILAGESDRVSRPGPRPDDHEGWHAIGDSDPTAPGHPIFAPDTWQYFQLRDVAVIDGLIAIAFGWTEPRTPPLTYLVLTHPRPGSIEAAASSTRGHLRALLAPGWRQRVERHGSITTASSSHEAADNAPRTWKTRSTQTSNDDGTGAARQADPSLTRRSKTSQAPARETARASGRTCHERGAVTSPRPSSGCNH